MKKVFLVIVAGVLAGVMMWLVARSKTSPKQRTASATVEPAAQPDSATPTNRTARAFHRSAIRHVRANDEPGFTNAPAAWEMQADEILATPGTDADISRKLLELYPRVPADGQADLALEIATRTADAQHEQLAKLMTNSTTPEEVVEVLLTDLLDRPDAIRLPLLLEIARSKENPKSPDAHELLEALLGEDYGEDWAVWEKKIAEHLASHPSESL